MFVGTGGVMAFCHESYAAFGVLSSELVGDIPEERVLGGRCGAMRWPASELVSVIPEGRVLGGRCGAMRWAASPTSSTNDLV